MSRREERAGKKLKRVEEMTSSVDPCKMETALEDPSHLVAFYLRV
jgi:hypothetical protein